MKLRYRGTEYQPKLSSFPVVAKGVEGKYRSAPWHFQQSAVDLRPLPAVSSLPLKFRGRIYEKLNYIIDKGEQSGYKVDALTIT